MVEEQALCRVHRVGQKRKVTTIRYLMRGSFEEVSFVGLTLTVLWRTDADTQQQVVEIQKRKKKLAEITFGSEQLSEDGIGLGTLLASHSFLRRQQSKSFLVPQVCP